MLNVAATCAAAGIIVGVVAKTGLGLKFSAIVIAYAGGSLFLTALYTALIVWVIGLAVPVTASYIICAVIAAPALTKLGVPDFAAHMFIFYYAVLSEVSPPTALSPFAAAAITGGDPYRTTLQSWKYTLPAFVVPFVFVLDPAGVGLLLKTAAGRLVAARRVDRVDRLHRDRRARRRRAEVAAARVQPVRALVLIAAGCCSSIRRRRPTHRPRRLARSALQWLGAARRPQVAAERMRKVDAVRAYGESHRIRQQGDPLGLRAAHHLERAGGAVGASPSRLRGSRSPSFYAWLSSDRVGMLALRADDRSADAARADVLDRAACSSRVDRPVRRPRDRRQKPSFFEDVKFLLVGPRGCCSSSTAARHPLLRSATCSPAAASASCSRCTCAWPVVSTTQTTRTADRSGPENARSWTISLIDAPVDAMISASRASPPGRSLIDTVKRAEPAVGDEADLDDAAEHREIDVAAAQRQHDAACP